MCIPMDTASCLTSTPAMITNYIRKEQLLCLPAVRLWPRWRDPPEADKSTLSAVVAKVLWRSRLAPTGGLNFTDPEH